MCSAGTVQGSRVSLLNWAETQIHNTGLVDNMG